MLLSLVSTILSSFFMAVMVVADKLMLKNCYDGSTKSAWFVSSVAGSVLGLCLTFISWLLTSEFSNNGSLSEIINVTINLFFWEGFLIFISGVLAIQILYHYFVCFSEDAHAATISGWIAATPLIIYGASFPIDFLLNQVSSNYSQLDSSFDYRFLFGVIFATCGLVFFELVTNDKIKIKKRQRIHLILMLLTNVLYTVMVEYTLSLQNDEYSREMYLLALLPYFWLGFGAGIRILIKERNRIIIKHIWTISIKKYIAIIFFVEIIGMLVFFFEYFGLSELQASYVSLVLGAHIIIVYIIDFFLDRENQGKNLSTIIKEVLFLLMAIIGISISTLYIFK